MKAVTAAAYIALTGIAAGFMSCSQNENSQASVLIPDNKLMEEYISFQSTTEPFNDGFSAYFDFSDGVEYAYKNPDTKQYLSDIVNQMKDHGTEFFSLANNKLEPLEGNSEEIFNKILNPASYRNHAAPIRAALDSIIDSNRPALLVTDYEEYDGKTIHKSAYARPYFTKWLKAGNDITFLIIDYNERGKAKKIYFTIFDGKDHKLLNSIKSALGDSDNYQEFTLANNNITFTSAYPGNGTKGGNFHDADLDDAISYVVEDPNSDYHYFMSENSYAEFYPILGPQDYYEIYETANSEAYQDKSKPFPPYSCTHFLRNLYADLSKLPYNDVELDIKVYNAEDDLYAFDLYNEALANKPGEKGIEDDPYWNADLTLKEEYRYSKADTKSLPEIVDLFVFDNDPAINPNIEQPAGKEIAIAFSDAFDGEIKGSGTADEGILIRIDVVIKSVDDKTKEELEPLFKWGDNNNLSESVRLALQDVRPTDNTIYTYYVKLYR